jgi:hypothetical protein
MQIHTLLLSRMRSHALARALQTFNVLDPINTTTTKMEDVVSKITQTYALFCEDDRGLTDEENDSVRLCCDLFRHASTSSEPLSASQQYRRIRARNFLRDVYRKIGLEVFVLCMLTWPITTLGKFESRIVLPGLLRWWKSVSTKRGLKSAADKICRENGIEELVKQVKTFAASMCPFPSLEL